MKFIKPKKHNVCICAPTDGEIDKDWLASIEKQTFKDYDMLLVFRKEPKEAPSCHYIVEEAPLGTSGAFRLCQETAYNLGYEIIVISEMDAIIACKMPG